MHLFVSPFLGREFPIAPPTSVRTLGVGSVVCRRRGDALPLFPCFCCDVDRGEIFLLGVGARSRSCERFTASWLWRWSGKSRRRKPLLQENLRQRAMGRAKEMQRLAARRLAKTRAVRGEKFRRGSRRRNPPWKIREVRPGRSPCRRKIWRRYGPHDGNDCQADVARGGTGHDATGLELDEE